MYQLFIALILCVSNALGTLLEDQRETVKAGEYSYFKINALDKYVYLQLTSISGDCDLYISEAMDLPTYENYSLHSATCGIDSAIIPKRFERPVRVGVYGHPAYETSDCILSLCLLDSPYLKDDFTDEWTEPTEVINSVLLQSCVGLYGKAEGESAFFQTLRNFLDILGWILSALAANLAANDSSLFDFVLALI